MKRRTTFLRNDPRMRAHTKDFLEALLADDDVQLEESLCGESRFSWKT